MSSSNCKWWHKTVATLTAGRKREMPEGAEAHTTVRRRACPGRPPVFNYRCSPRKDCP